MAQLEIEARFLLAARHRTDRLAGDHPLSDGALNPVQPSQERMIPVSVFDDQYLPVTLERAGEEHAAVERGDDLCAGPGLEGEALRGDAELVILAEAAHQPAARRVEQGAAG